MTTVCVRQVFEEIHSQRVIARDILDVQDGDFSCANFLWATWKAHETMALYVRHQFYEHPLIAAVLTRHLADNHVKPDDSVPLKVVGLDKAVKNINARLDSVQSTADNITEKLKSLTLDVFHLAKNVENTSWDFGGKAKKKIKDKDAKDPKPTGHH
jgi:hypothetical protein